MIVTLSLTQDETKMIVEQLLQAAARREKANDPEYVAEAQQMVRTAYYIDHMSKVDGLFGRVARKGE